MSWKDILYYQRAQKAAILLLLVLILLTLILYAVLPIGKRSTMVIAQNDSLVREFEEFERSLKDRELQSSSDVSTTLNYNGRRYSEQAVKQNGATPDSRQRDYIVFPKSEKLSEGETISLNETDTAQWKKIPGIGSSFASRIVKYHQLLGGFVSVDQLREVYGIDDEMFSRISPYILHDTNFRKIQINKQEFKELLSHPYLNYKQVQAIVNLRKKKGNIFSINELSMLDEFTTEDVERLKPYLEF